MSSDERWIPVDPEIRAGMYTHIDQVPDHVRLRVYEHEFEGRDPWCEYVTENNLVRPDHSRQQRGHMQRTEDRWKTFMQERGRHHALCTPTDAEEYAQRLRNEFELSISSAAMYWADVERFYRWMFHHVEYPHRYHPFVMAAANYDTGNALWTYAITKE